MSIGIGIGYIPAILENIEYISVGLSSYACLGNVHTNKIILDECSTVVEIDHVRNLKDCLERKNG